MKKLLIVSWSAGAGHVRAAEAIEKAAAVKYPNLEAQHIDLADYISLPMKKAIIDSYDIIVKRVPELWGFLYGKINSRKGADRLTKLTKQLKQANSLKFRKFVSAYKPDAIICTHFLATDILLSAKKRWSISQPISTLITDYDIHNLWFVPGTKYYFVATEKMKQKMIQQRITSAKNIVVSGIPVDPIFYKTKSTALLKKKHKIPTNKRVVLVLSGGQGLAKSSKIVKTLLKINLPMTIVAIAGNNKRLENALKKINPPKHIKFFPVGWTDKIDEYMRMADTIISKPGGITTSECIALKKPMIIIDPIPGQEDHNADHLLTYGLGVIARSPEDLEYFVKTPFSYPKQKTSVPATDIILKTLLK